MTIWITHLAVAVAVSLAAASQPMAEHAEPPPAATELESWEAESFSMDLPVDWEQVDLSNHTYISSKPTDVRAHFLQPAEDGDGAAVLLQYTAEPAPEEPVPDERILHVLEDARAGMTTMPPDELQYFVEDKGHGCLAGFQIVRPPEMTPVSGMPGQHFAFDYEYGCFNGGVPIRGWAWVAFSPDGRKHNIFMTAHEDIWIEDFETLQAVTASIAVPQ